MRELDGAALSFGAYERPNKYPHDMLGVRRAAPGWSLPSLMRVLICQEISARSGVSQFYVN